MSTPENNVRTAKELLEVAMPQGDYGAIRSLVTPDCTILRAGFSSIYSLTDDPIPSKGNFIEWLTRGWKVLQEGLSDQTAITTAEAAAGDTVMLRYHMTALHSGTFCGAPATGRRVEWDEVSVLHFTDGGKVSDMWYMCEELSLAHQIGYGISL